MTAELIAFPSVEAPPQHWLIFNPARQITGCACGHPAHKTDHGYGNSIVDHLIQVGANAAQ